MNKVWPTPEKPPLELCGRKTRFDSLYARANYVREQIEGRGCRAEDVADALGISTTVVSRIRNAGGYGREKKQSPSYQNSRKLSHTMGVKLGHMGNEYNRLDIEDKVQLVDDFINNGKHTGSLVEFLIEFYFTRKMMEND